MLDMFILLCVFFTNIYLLSPKSIGQGTLGFRDFNLNYSYS
jgi:hypothetical protein